MKPEIEGDVEVKVGVGVGWGAAIAALPEQQRKAIGGILIAILVVIFFLVFQGGMFALGKGELFARKCWELQFRDDRVFKVNTCTGKIIELDKKTLEPKTQ